METTTIILACILMPALLYYESKEIPKGILPGLIFCLGGDVFLALPQKKMGINAFSPGSIL